MYTDQMTSFVVFDLRLQFAHSGLSVQILWVNTVHPVESEMI